MKTLRIAALAACLAVTLNACLTYEKPGGTAQEWEQVKAKCQLEAAREVPPNYTTRVNPASEQSGQQCTKKGGCQQYTTYTPAEAVRVDDNHTLREQVIKGCYARHGWTRRQLIQ